MSWYLTNKPSVPKYSFIKDVDEFTQHTEVFNYNKEFDELLIRFDGACVPVNPNGNMGYGWAIFHKDDVVAHGWGYLFQAGRWQTSNNIAEWSSLYFGVKHLIDNELKCKRLTIIGDSMLVVNQVNGDWKINSGKPYTYFANMFFTIKGLLPKKTKVYWQGRDNNDYCDSLSNKFLEL